ncbi:MAG: peptide ABC transporter substrate-binding protein, partial [Thermostichales cyanobacterium DRC_bins_46]
SFLLAALLLSFLGYYWQPSVFAQSPELSIAINRDESTLQPYTYVTGYPGWNLLNLIYDTLFILDAENQPQPWLVESMQVSEDGKTYTLKLKEGVKWQDGETLTSADDKIAYEFYKDKRHSRWTPPMRSIAQIDTPNPQTVVFNLESANAGFVYQPLADVPIIPQHIWQGTTDPKTLETRVGSGPYQLQEYQSDQIYRLRAHPNYFAGKPAIEELLIPIIPENTTIFSALRTGEIQATTRPTPPELVQEFERDANLKVVRGAGFGSTLLQFNSERDPWSQVAVRQAMDLAIDREQLVERVLLGYGTKAESGWFHPASPAHNPDLRSLYNLEQAQSLLEEQGFRDSNGNGIREANGQEMEGSLLVAANNPIRLRTAELIAADLDKIGIRLTVTALEPESLDARVWPDGDVSKGRDYDLAIWGWSAPVQINPLRMISLVHSDPAIGTLNIGGYRNPEADALAEVWTATADPAEQIQRSHQLEALIAEEVPFAMLFFEDGIYSFRPQAYDRWTFQKGQGIFQKLSFLPDVRL